MDHKSTFFIRQHLQQRDTGYVAGDQIRGRKRRKLQTHTTDLGKDVCEHVVKTLCTTLPAPSQSHELNLCDVQPLGAFYQSPEARSLTHELSVHASDPAHEPKRTAATLQPSRNKHGRPEKLDHARSIDVQYLQRRHEPCSDTTSSVEINTCYPQNDEHIVGDDTTHDPATQIVCYGMLHEVEPPSELLSRNVHQSNLKWDGQAFICESLSNTNIVRLSARSSQLLKRLTHDAGLSLQFVLHEHKTIKTDQRLNRQDPSTSASGQAFVLSVNLYGPVGLALGTGEWLSTIGMYLQKPEHCDRNVQYCNPQCLAFGEAESTMTHDLECESEVPLEPQARTCPVTLAELYETNEYSEHDQPVGIVTPLHRHQKQALTFMTQRELGWVMTDDRIDIWRREIDERNVVRYRNRLTGESQVVPPKPFRGGILADDMGLGKTCSMLALIAVNTWRDEMVGDTLHHAQGHVKSTLIVVPLSLLDVWSEQIESHFVPNTVRHCIYHGQHSRPQGVLTGEYDIVITTYDMVAREWKKSLLDKSCLFGVVWHRVVLDEAHVIRTRRTISARAMAALRAERRWCITGTPVQNRLTDMYSLLRFLGVDPYDQYKTFEEQILRPFKTGHDTALKKLQALVKAIVVRRPRSIVALPPAYERVESVAFSDLERLCYDGARDNVIEIIDSAIDGTQPNRSTCFNAFQKINDLRYICNHGTRPMRRRMKRGSSDNGVRSSFAFELDELLSGTGQMCCQCGIHLCEENNSQHNAIDTTASEEQTSDISVLCVSCQHDINEETPLPEPTPSLCNGTKISTYGPSSKIQALVQQINNIPTGDKCVIFSYWTSTLEIVQCTLTNIGITNVYFHGSLSPPKRKQVLQTFTTEPSIRVILVSITCGGQGLDLTAANHAILLEPQWNPMLEEQALSRVYRIGQGKPVHMIRFVVQHTWEEKIRTLQGRKKTLADLVVDRRCLGDGNGGKKQLYLLRELVM